MSKIKEFENIPDIDIEGEETLEEAVADCKALFGKYNKELFNGEVSLERCSEARLVLLTLAHRSHHNMEYSTACLKAELLPTSTGPNLDNLAPLVGVERLEAGKATAVIRFTLSAPRTSATGIPEGTQVRTADKRYFKTEKYAEILPGELTVDVVAVADEAGSNSDGIAEGEINVLVILSRMCPGQKVFRQARAVRIRKVTIHLPDVSTMHLRFSQWPVRWMPMNTLHRAGGPMWQIRRSFARKDTRSTFTF